MVAWLIVLAVYYVAAAGWVWRCLNIKNPVARVAAASTWPAVFVWQLWLCRVCK